MRVKVLNEGLDSNYLTDEGIKSYNRAKRAGLAQFYDEYIGTFYFTDIYRNFLFYR